ncbi:ADP-dependent NAD(P)H-hydrate dehydratase [Arcanobacterium pinnipediorum]|uniref:ADP-dependent (S)-NAD(P)H-hydrate dehydratase n=1 Tax=Arcanobacterium pinnipediorum TaxID=1503041 RepID=A0ABY5AFS5_9ACTO|nr:ADP/ATP-dependent (S)-NAD(P)H-hydrate dehydratase [Arcanobacterium pinnipediorum]USR79059.1 NAD(P)H-hydrate dehydratase [Arcanobacterium pinnipediorum]
MAVSSVTDDDIRRWWPIPGADDHKYTRGVLGVVTGSAQYPGAGVLSVGAALSCGPGMVRYLGTSPLVISRYPEVVPIFGQVQAWLIGSGISAEEDMTVPIDTVVDSGLPAVFDAGGLNMIGQRRLSPHHVLTPHPGELAELLRARGEDVSRAQVENDMVSYTRLAAKLTGAVVATTANNDVIADPVGKVFIQSGATSWRATAGAGDVYAGIVGALLTLWQAQQRSAVDAAWLAAAGAYLHGRAANLAAGANAGVGYPIKASNISDALGPIICQILNPLR